MFEASADCTGCAIAAQLDSSSPRLSHERICPVAIDYASDYCVMTNEEDWRSRLSAVSLLATAQPT